MTKRTLSGLSQDLEQVGLSTPLESYGEVPEIVEFAGQTLPDYHTGDFQDDDISGWQPIPPRGLSGAPLPTEEEQQQQLHQVERQKSIFHGFSTTVLVDLEVIGTGDVKPNNLEGIHEAFARDKWMRRPQHTLFLPGAVHVPKPPGHRSNGSGQRSQEAERWTGHCDRIWSALEPSIKLASKFLTYIFPQFDVTSNRAKYEADGARFDLQDSPEPIPPLFSFRRLSELECAAQRGREERLDRLHVVSDDIEIAIADGLFDPVRRQPLQRGKWNGLTVLPRASNKKTRIYLAYQTILPLLRTDLTPSMRLVEQFWVAIILLRGFSQCLDKAAQSLDNGGGNKLNLMQGEELSMERAMLGGDLVSLLHRLDTGESGRDIPQLGLLLRLPSVEEEVSCCQQQVEKRVSNSKVDHWPVTLAYLEDMQQEEFWKSFVHMWGADATAIYPHMEGRQTTWARNADQEWEEASYARVWPTAMEPIWAFWVDEVNIIDTLFMDARELSAYSIGRARKARAQRIAQHIKTLRL
ncbi:MAG: hypothetical protein M1818_007598 [Claussenomyces sp. TS43310]|nr:MAG: hypothetical protein M1818_007598 [Claussenomyces sp. TS43310]